MRGAEHHLFQSHCDVPKTPSLATSSWRRLDVPPPHPPEAKAARAQPSEESPAWAGGIARRTEPHEQRQSTVHEERHRPPLLCTTMHHRGQVAGLRLHMLQQLHGPPQHPVFHPITYTARAGCKLFRTTVLSFAQVPSPAQCGPDLKSCSNPNSLLKQQGLKCS